MPLDDDEKARACNLAVLHERQSNKDDLALQSRNTEAIAK
jgi:hypothetical protein